MKRRMLRMIAMGVALGLVLLAVQQALRIPSQLFLKGYWIAGGLVVLGAAALNLLYTRRYHRRMQVAAPLLEEGRYREYLAAVEALLRTARGRYLRAILTINLCAGYAGLKEYNRAIQLLEGLEEQRLPRVAKAVYRLNLCHCYFYTLQGDKAMALYRASQQIFAPFAQGEAYGGSLAVLDIFAALYQGQPDRGAALLAETRVRWPGERLQEHYRYLAEQLAQEGWVEAPPENGAKTW